MKEPIVACRFGNWYNKDAILTYLLDPERFGERRALCSHIKRLKDIVELKLQRSDEDTAASAANNGGAEHAAVPFKNDLASHNIHLATFVCPITMKPMNGQYRFIYLKTCGHVFSEQAVKEVSSQECYVVFLFVCFQILFED